MFRNMVALGLTVLFYERVDGVEKARHSSVSGLNCTVMAYLSHLR